MTQSSIQTCSNKNAKIRVDIFTSSSCSRCAKAKAQLQQLIKELGPEQFEYREVNIIDEIDYAVEMGVLNASAIAINGTLAFAISPKAQTLRNKLAACLAESNSLGHPALSLIDTGK